LIVSVTFDGETIPGTVLSFAIPSKELQVRRTKFWGVNGESQIVGGLSGRTLQIPMWLHDESFVTAKDIGDYIEGLEFLIGTTGPLKVISNADYPEFFESTLDGVLLVPDPGIIYDHAGGLGGFWIAFIILQFRQH
jgi:hypothetical protein